jgi:hypothetical protein
MRTDELIELLARDLPTAPERPDALLLRWLPLSAVAALCALVVGLGLRPDLTTPVGTSATLPKWIFGAALAVAAGAAALRLARPDASPTGAGLAVAVAIAAVVAAFALDSSGRSFADGSLLGALKCLSVVPLLALPPAVAFLHALKAGAVTRPRLAGGLAGASAAGVAIMIYALNCTEDGAVFLSVWYVGAALIVTAACAAAGSRVLRW